ncbi:MAG: hypothetical protein FJZ43_02475 [Candidatus Staskawiczbacteria bacterium]|nr:hypothetical protein [Candidatus Staskawiczbacteria bacterium]
MDKIPVKNLDKLPKTAGVYFFYAKKDLIYIGKAINIKDRVKNHFHQPSYRDNLFIDKVTKIDFIETNSEIEALVLEANLIKKHLPKFNVVWRDDKNYFYVAIDHNQNGIPYVFITHQIHKSKTLHIKSSAIGPFVEGNAIKKVLKFLRKVFPFYTSKNHPKQKCTWCHLDLCPGPNPDIKDYKNNLKKLSLILQGKRKSVLSSLKKEMHNLSKEKNFEEAGKIRDKIFALERVMEHTKVISNEITHAKWLKTQEELREILDFDSKISRIECYDISNIHGKNATGSMIVFEDGNPVKSQYKKFRIKMKNEPNDIAMLKEVLQRRFSHEDWTLPEVILIDGGIAQLNIAINTINKPKNVRVISIAKGKQELFIEGKKNQIPLKELRQDVYNLVKHLDDEAHRFAVTYHKSLRKKSLGLNN